MSPIARISRVLVGIDFDEASTSALKMADVLASAWNADLTVLHAATLDVPAYFTAAQIEMLEAEPEQTRERTADRLRTFAEGHVQRAVHAVVENGPPSDYSRRRRRCRRASSTDTHGQFASIVEVLTECMHPVVFIPLSEGIFERSSS